MKSKITFKDIWNKDHILECIVLVGSVILIMTSIAAIIYGNIQHNVNPNWINYSIILYNIRYAINIFIGAVYGLFTYNYLVYYKTRKEDLTYYLKIYHDTIINKENNSTKM